MPDITLQNQARAMCYVNKDKLVEAFKNITLSKKQSERGAAKDANFKVTDKSTEHTSAGGRKVARCYNCGEIGQLLPNCPKPKREKGSCYRCGSMSHRIRDCPKDQTTATPRITTPPARTTPGSTSAAVQPASLPQPYMVNVNYAITTNEGVVHKCIISGMLDSGSPISVKESLVPTCARIPLNTGEQFFGLNGSRLQTDFIYKTNIDVEGIKADVRFLVVPDKTMSFPIILGRDFISNPSIKGNLNIFNSHNTSENSELLFLQQLMSIKYVESPSNANKELRINEKLDREISNQIMVSYENDYLKTYETSSIKDDFEVKIILKHEQPISFRPGRLSYVDKESLKILLDEMIKVGIIRVSDSPYASPIVLNRKKKGEFRLCIDYREINKITIRDNYPPPLIEDNIDRLRGKKIYTRLDLRNGYYHVKMHEDSVKYTAFITPLGHYEFLRLPFGLTDGPKKFAKYIAKVFEPLIKNEEVLVYFDDLLIASVDLVEHLDTLRRVFKIAGEQNLNFRFDKCSFAKYGIEYLGYRIDEQGIRPGIANVAAIKEYPSPRDVKEAHRFVCMASFFRRFIPNFSVLAKPLYDLNKEDSVKTRSIVSRR